MTRALIWNWILMTTKSASRAAPLSIPLSAVSFSKGSLIQAVITVTTMCCARQFHTFGKRLTA